jgi:hypothetical protein
LRLLIPNTAGFSQSAAAAAHRPALPIAAGRAVLVADAAVLIKIVSGAFK